MPFVCTMLLQPLHNFVECVLRPLAFSLLSVKLQPGCEETAGHEMLKMVQGLEHLLRFIFLSKSDLLFRMRKMHRKRCDSDDLVSCRCPPRRDRVSKLSCPSDYVGRLTTIMRLSQ